MNEAFLKTLCSIDIPYPPIVSRFWFFPKALPKQSSFFKHGNKAQFGENLEFFKLMVGAEMARSNVSRGVILSLSVKEISKIAELMEINDEKLTPHLFQRELALLIDDTQRLVERTVRVVTLSRNGVVTITDTGASIFAILSYRNPKSMMRFLSTPETTEELLNCLNDERLLG